MNLVENGYEALEFYNPVNQGNQSILAQEANVDTTLFANITGQIAFAKIHQGFKNDDYVVSGLVPNMPSPFLDGEKVPGIAQLGDDAAVVAEGNAFPESTFGEEYTNLPGTTKRGNIVPVTKEAVFADRTRLVLKRAFQVGEFLGLNKEKRLCDVVIGATNNYSRNGVASDTYQTAAPWINRLQQALTDWTSLEAAEHLFSEMVDPNTGEPIGIGGKKLLVTEFKIRTAQRIAGALQIRTVENGVETISNNNMQTYAPVASKVLYSRLKAAGETAANAKKMWFTGDFSKAFGYVENWGISVVQSPQNTGRDFTHDIVTEVKASERGAAAVVEPREVIKCQEHALA